MARVAYIMTQTCKNYDKLIEIREDILIFFTVTE